ncbi:hypothetical protein Acr_03g0001670 [Actinidia rufa]|uniref:Uncharacterized protein n=1 Tax=Actinidia rufa TaxID=165716 RepID=A0A7J0EAB0_9ERIC|nr:hypothetical protein Acr_03g0001670 [Actinidia rufa]
MAVAENVGINGGAENRTDSHAPNDADPSKSNHMGTHHSNGNPILRSNDQNCHQQQNGTVNHKTQVGLAQHGMNGSGVQNHRTVENGDDGSEGFKRELRDLEEFLSKLNPMAEEFVPPSLGNHIPVFAFALWWPLGLLKNNLQHSLLAVDRWSTVVYVVTLILFSVFAFIEFTDEEGARNALSLAGTMLGYYPVRVVLPSKTAIAPVNPTFLPRVRSSSTGSLASQVFFMLEQSLRNRMYMKAVLTQSSALEAAWRLSSFNSHWFC